MMFIATAWAQEAAPAAAAAAAGAPANATVVTALFQYAPILLIFAVFYFLIIKPQNQAAKDQQKAIEALKKGDVVVTESGLVGEVVKTGDTFVTLRINAEDTISVVKATVRRTLDAETAKGWEPAPLPGKKK